MAWLATCSFFIPKWCRNLSSDKMSWIFRHCLFFQLYILQLFSQWQHSLSWGTGRGSEAVWKIDFSFFFSPWNDDIYRFLNWNFLLLNGKEPGTGAINEKNNNSIENEKKRKKPLRIKLRVQTSETKLRIIIGRKSFTKLKSEKQPNSKFVLYIIYNLLVAFFCVIHFPTYPFSLIHFTSSCVVRSDYHWY